MQVDRAEAQRCAADEHGAPAVGREQLVELAGALGRAEQRRALAELGDRGEPVHVAVDAGSGYRRYSIEQVPVAQVIRRLRDQEEAMPAGRLGSAREIAQDFDVAVLGDEHLRSASDSKHIMHAAPESPEAARAHQSSARPGRAAPMTAPVRSWTCALKPPSELPRSAVRAEA